MSNPHMNLGGLDSKSHVDVKYRSAQYEKLASFMNADADEIGKNHSENVPDTAVEDCTGWQKWTCDDR